jgi:chorismate synthase
MSANSIGEVFKVSTFGESHGPFIGALIEGCPAGLPIDEAFIQQEMDRRKPGQSSISSPRKESDTCQIISGVFQGITLGTPIALLIPNEDARPQDYDAMKDKLRPSHADYTYLAKYGIRDYRGGGRASARETAARVAAGAIAKLLLAKKGIQINAYVQEVGKIRVGKDYTELDLSKTEESIVRCPDKLVSDTMIKLIEKARREGDSLGGTIKCIAKGVPAGWGEPVFDKLHADLGKAMLSINAVKGFEYGSGFAGARMKGSEHNDVFENDGGKIITRTNFSGGIQGGISNGMDIYCNIAFKPVATISQTQETIDLKGKKTEIQGKGRHDPCVLPRAVPIVEAMAAIVLAEHMLRSRLATL